MSYIEFANSFREEHRGQPKYVKPNGKMPVTDQIFFKQGEMWNQGQGFSWEEDAFIHACEQAITRVEKDPINHEGLKLQEQFSKEKFVDNILKYTLE